MYKDIAGIILEKNKSISPLTVAIDGRCASGKTTLAGQLEKELCCNIFHMDDFFLTPEMRTKERLGEAGGNVDRERFFLEVMTPLLKGESFSYRPFSCRDNSLGEPVPVTPKSINIIEGAYSCHPYLWDCYGLRIFMTAAYDTQLSRIRTRNGEEGAINFINRWIPLEEKYFSAFDIASGCDIVLET